MLPESRHDGAVRVPLDLLPGSLERGDLFLALGLEGAQADLQFHERAPRLSEGTLGVGLGLVQVLLHRCLTLGHSLKSRLEVLLRSVHGIQGVLHVHATSLDEGFCRLDSLVDLLLQLVDRLVCLFHHGPRGPPVHSLLTALLLRLQVVRVLLLSLADLLLQGRADVLHLGDTRLQLGQLSLGFCQRARLHGLQFLDLLVHVLGGVCDRVRHLFHGRLNPLLAGGVGRVIFQVDCALVAGKGDPSLSIIPVGLGLHAQDAQGLILGGFLHGIQNLSDIHLANGLPALDRKLVSHRHNSSAHVPAAELVDELLLGDLPAAGSVDSLEGGLELGLGEEGILLLTQLWQLCREFGETGLCDLWCLFADLQEEGVGVNRLLGHMLLQGIVDVCQVNGSHKVLLLVD
mmetsp:Transcript_5306/g.12020  ORF Transcript_5306/g.12020 Transcript_5306/m.12020 type:complete len:402 (+) Transcript_5306:1503-2708(+)